MEEQIELLRELWTERSVTHDGTYEHVTGGRPRAAAGAATDPDLVRRRVDPAYRRIGRLADGWFPQVPPGPTLDEARAIVEESARDAGRDPATLGMEGRVSWTDDGVEKLVDHVGRWRDAGASHLSINTMDAGLGSVDGHLAALAAAAERCSDACRGQQLDDPGQVRERRRSPRGAGPARASPGSRRTARRASGRPRGSPNIVSAAASRKRISSLAGRELERLLERGRPARRGRPPARRSNAASMIS